MSQRHPPPTLQLYPPHRRSALRSFPFYCSAPCNSHCPAVTQGPEPPCPDPLIAPAVGTEYVCSYVSKSDAAEGSAPMLHTSVQLLKDSGKSTEQVARSLVAKVLNQHNGSFTIGIVMANRLLRGEGDHRFSHIAAYHDSAQYTLPLSSDTSPPPKTYRSLSLDGDDAYTFTDLDSYKPAQRRCRTCRPSR